MEALSDLAAERVVIAGVAQDSETYWDIEPFIKPDSMTDDVNQVIFKAIKKAYEEEPETRIDSTLIRSKANQLGLSHFVEKPEEIDYIKDIVECRVEQTHVPKYAAIVRKLQIARLIYDQLGQSQQDILQIKSDESIDGILAIAQNRILDFSSLLDNETNNKIIHISEGLDEYFSYISDPANIRDIVGLSTGMPIFDDHIGGLRRQAVTVVGARTGVGKSMISDNIALHITKKLNIPILYLDTEMDVTGHWNRLMACISGVPIKIIENGKFSLNEIKYKEVKKAKKILSNIPYHYINIAGKAFEETLSLARRWIRKSVGRDENGRTKDCLIIYDYLKLMGADNLNDSLKEYQILGFQMTSLHNFGVRNDVPIFASVQLNRDGINNEGLESFSQSDRIGWLASAAAIYKYKNNDEMAKTAADGNRKIVVVKSRYGSVNMHNEYINIKFDGSIARITEGRLSNHIEIEEKSSTHDKIEF
jgi:replicative DNA helicase